MSFKTRTEDLWDTPTTDLGAESEPSDGGEHSEVADWQRTRRDGRSLFHRWGAAYRKERLLILRHRMNLWVKESDQWRRLSQGTIILVVIHMSIALHVISVLREKWIVSEMIYNALMGMLNTSSRCVCVCVCVCVCASGVRS